jgi:hypothetical protein
MIWQYVIPLLLIVGAFASSEAGFRLGRWCGPRDEIFSKQLNLISKAAFALVAFLLAFNFSGAASRYVDRLDMVVKEANALGTAYLRTDLLAQPARGELKMAIRAYTVSRLDLIDRAPTAARSLLARVVPQQHRLWEIALKGTGDNADLGSMVLPSINDVIDLHKTHLSAARRHIPVEITIALYASAAMSLALAAFGNGQISRRFPILNFVYGFLLVAVLWMTLDLDNPDRGWIQISTQPLLDALESMKP